MPYLNNQKLKSLGLKDFGENVQISSKCSIYGAHNISIGSNVRIDDFCIISAGSGGIQIGNFVHIACYCSLIGDGSIHLEDFSGISSRVAIYSSNDDYSGAYLTNPCVPKEYTNVSSGSVVLKKHVIVGSGTIILPNIEIGYGTAIGALSLVVKSCEDLSIYSGNPAKRIKRRKSEFEIMEKELLNTL